MGEGTVGEFVVGTAKDGCTNSALVGLMLGDVGFVVGLELVVLFESSTGVDTGLLFGDGGKPMDPKF